MDGGRISARMAAMMIIEESVKLPAQFRVEEELREQLSGRPGHQRCLEGRGELLLIVHEVPKPRAPERTGLYFWKNRDGRWHQASGPGLSGLGELLDRYSKAIDGHGELVDEADTAAEIFTILRHSGPLARSTRNLVQALEQTLAMDPDDREIRGYRDRSREIERAADLLNNDARVTLQFWQAERSEQQARSAARLGRIAYRLNLLAGFFLPLVALGGLFGMNMDRWGGMFWGVVFLGLMIGGLLLWAVGRNTGRDADFEDEEGSP
jgi:hypothetical protein